MDEFHVAEFRIDNLILNHSFLKSGFRVNIRISSSSSNDLSFILWDVYLCHVVYSLTMGMIPFYQVCANASAFLFLALHFLLLNLWIGSQKAALLGFMLFLSIWCLIYDIRI